MKSEKNASSPMKRPKQKKSSTKRNDGWIARNSFGLMCGGLVAIAIIVFIGIFGVGKYAANETWIYVPKDATTADVRDSLKTKLGMVAGNRTYLLWRLQGGDPKKSHGKYRIAAGENALRFSRRLKAGRQTPIEVSFIGARSIDKIARRIAKQMEFSDTAFIDACNTVLVDSGFKAAEFPAAFLPDTYQFYFTDDAAKVVSTLVRYRNKFWDENRLEQAGALGLTPIEVATVASIVEEESSKNDERPKIARLYLNRLKRGMKLQADPTVKFAIGNFELRRITGEHVRFKSPYNTYVNSGLPPGPIRIADKTTIDGVLNAPSHDYIYMCAKSDFSGYHDFAKTYDEHMNNARRYHLELNKRNIH